MCVCILVDYFFKKSFPTKYRMNINRNIREFVAFDDALFSTCKIRRTGKVGPRPWGGTQNPGPWGGTLEWDSHICFSNILNHIVFFIRHQKDSIWMIFSIFEENEVNTCFSLLKPLFPKHLFSKFLFEILMFFSQWKYN